MRCTPARILRCVVALGSSTLLVACSDDASTTGAESGAAGARSSQAQGNDGTPGEPALRAAWPPASPDCTLQAPGDVKTFFHSTACPCAAAPDTPYLNATVGEYCADDFWAGYAAAFDLPVQPLPVSGSWPGADRAWFRPSIDSPVLGYGASFSRRVEGIFTPNTDTRVYTGSGVAFLQVTVARHAPDDPDTFLEGRAYTFWPAGELQSLYSEDISLQGRRARLFSGRVLANNLIAPSSSPGTESQLGLEIGMKLIDAPGRGIAIVGLIPLGNGQGEPEADPDVVCELEGIIASYRLESSPSAPSSLCDADW